MKSFFNIPHIRIFLILGALIGLLSACGQKGPLYLPPKPGQALSKPQPTQPAVPPVEETSSTSQ